MSRRRTGGPGLRVVTANVNGIRAAVRRGGLAWLESAAPDVVTLQEVRASDAELRAASPLALEESQSPAGLNALPPQSGTDLPSNRYP